jgi:hypothetical protein
MIKNADFNDPLDTNPYKFGHNDINKFSLFVKGKLVLSEDLCLDKDNEKTSLVGYRALFEGSGKHHSNSRQITHEMYINGYFKLIFDLTLDRGASEDHTSHPVKGNIRIELKFNKPLPEAITCLLYIEYDNTVLVDFSRNVTTDF